jgi:hypothetical membrane protein
MAGAPLLLRAFRNLSLLAGILSPIVLAVTIAVVAAHRPDYSHIKSALSELGAVGRPHATFMNLAGIIPAGVLTALSGPAIYSVFGKSRLSRAGEIALILAGIGFIGTALFAWRGSPNDLSVTNNKLHLTFALSGFFCLALAPLLFGLQARKNSRERFWFSILVSALIFVFGFVLPRPPYLGLFQRGALTVFFVWLIAASVTGFRQRCRTAR